MKKSAIAILMTTVILVSLMAPLLLVQAYTSTANGVTVDGVLKSDTYVLYPYTKENLYLGISKYGELINGEASPKVGLKYGIMDVFANSYVNEEDWSQGWFIDIHYAFKNNSYANVWAFAMYTDLSGISGIGGDWKEACVNGPLGAPYGGRKTSAYAYTAPIKVLYDGPRRFIAMTNTTIFEDSAETHPLVGVVLTFVFDKVKKCVIVYKDIKRLDEGKWGRTFQVEFSNRGEWDIGTTAAPPSYAYFYDNLQTAYTQGSNYQYHDFYDTDSGDGITGFDVAQMINEAGTYVGFAAFWPQLFGKLVDGTPHITPEEVLHSLCTKMYNQTWGSLTTTGALVDLDLQTPAWPSTDEYPRGAGVWSDEPMVFKNGVLQSGAQYTWISADNTITFGTEPNDGDYITIVYKHQFNEGPQNMDDYIDEPKTPYVIGEWCFDLEDVDMKRQFRAVSVYGLTDRHDAQDVDAYADSATWATVNDNLVDSEVQYYLNETFNPWDLYAAIEKQDYRWYYSAASAGTTKTLTAGLDDPLYYSVLGTSTPRWTGYNITESGAGAAESVWVNTFQNGAGVSNSKNWALLLNSSSNNQGGSDGYEMLKVTPIANTSAGPAGPLTLQLKDLVDFDFWYKMAATSVGFGPHIEIKVSSTAAGGETALWANIAAENSNPSNTVGTWYQYTLNNIEDFVGAPSADTAFFLTGGGAGGSGVDPGPHSYEYFTANDKLGNYYVNSIGIQTQNGAIAYVDDLSVGYLNRLSGIRYERVYNMEENKLIPSDWNAYCSFAERVTCGSTLIPRIGYNTTAVSYAITFTTGVITFYGSPTGALQVWYSTIEENDKGRYEWATVGRDSQAIDSAGLGLITAGFKNKDIEIGLTGADMYGADPSLNMPYVMAKWGGTGDTRNDYYKQTTPEPYRTGLKSNWCTTWPISSSDMITVGGAYANLLAWYANDFTDAMFGLPDFATGSPYSGMVTPVSCWNRGWNGTWNVYSSSNETGYAVITTYKDLNGTVLFLIWGHWGRDTYYASKWFHEGGKIQLQSTPRGITSVILQIPYTLTAGEGYKPGTISIVECPGTITEARWTHNSELKGEIHDP